MKNKVDEIKWKPIVTEHPEPEKRYRNSTPNKQPEYQPLSARYEVPCLMPRKSIKSLLKTHLTN